MIESRSPLFPLAHAVRSEIAREQGQDKAARMDMDLAFRNAKRSTPLLNSYLLCLKGISLARQAEWKLAIAPWSQVARSGKNQVHARRMLALMHCNATPVRKRLPARALEEAELASQWRPDEDWSVEMAYGVALYKSDQQAAALERAERAVELATDEHRQFCESLLQKIRDQQDITWTFDRRLAGSQSPVALFFVDPLHRGLSLSFSCLSCVSWWPCLSSFRGGRLPQRVIVDGHFPMPRSWVVPSSSWHWRWKRTTFGHQEWNCP